MLPFGPMEAFFIPEIRELRRRGHEVVVVPMWPRGPVAHDDAREMLDATLQQPVISTEIALAAAAQIARAPVRAARAAGTVLRSRSPRLLAKNSSVFAKGLWLAGVARRIGADHLHAQWGATTATMALVAHEATRIPWSFTVHRWDISENNILLHKARSARFVRAISHRGASAVAARVGPHAHKVRVLHMGVDLPVRGIHPVTSGSKLRVITAANLLEIKGHRYLLDATAALASRGVDVRVELAGGGPLEQQLRGQIASLGLADKITLLGVLPHAELLAGLQSGRWDAAVLPSITLPDGEQEGIPVFLMEAMASGVPVVSTDTGGIPELVSADAGMLIPEKDSATLATALERLARDPDLRRRFAEGGLRVVQRDFAVGAVIERFEGWLAGA
jgi:colanic acid/amylovoran biosynthesis glycosyltransferase